MIENLSIAVQTVLDPATLMVVVVAGAFGLVVGSLPGLTATLATALMVPFAFFLEPIPAIASIISMSAMAIFAGDVPGALLRIPGTPSSAAYTNDAYALTQRGKGPLALGLSLTSSVIGGIAGIFALIVLAPLLGKLAMNFTSYEYFWVAVLGLTASVIVSSGSQVKGAVALMLGLLLSTVGLDISMGVPRFTFGEDELLRGINFIPAMIGLFGVAEILRGIVGGTGTHRIPGFQGKGFARETVSALWRHKRALGTGSAVGSFVGALPGAGADIAAWIAYAFTKRGRRRVRANTVGDAAELDDLTRPIVGASSANNAGLSSAFIPTLAFGIPGDTITAILLGVLLVKGIIPGPQLFTGDVSTLYSIYFVFLISILVLLPLGYLLIRLSHNVLRIPREILTSVIIAVCIVGSYAVNSSNFEVLLILGFGVVGFALERWGAPLAPVVLGLVLGPIVERNFMQSVIKTEWDLFQFFTRPISAALVIATLLLLFAPMLLRMLRRLLASRKRSVGAECD
ncbi:tripartite tricarboxylate transporter permease [Brevibacterium album]|uniref:tripartite tricarboxylate transporter permease n=1 Tax=Brevibacterium album TaxID=417948 RepID=UPI00040D7D9A|nr:tripartite tricarboxylate transporter permease [Brevibacterium album]